MPRLLDLLYIQFMNPHSFLDFSRFRPPTASEQQEYILCDRCRTNQGTNEATAKLLLCDSCYEKWQDENLSPCCGVEFDKDIRICPKCKEHV